MPKSTGSAKTQILKLEQCAGSMSPSTSHVASCGHTPWALLLLDPLSISLSISVVVKKKKNPVKAVSDGLEENQFASVVAWLQMVASGL